MSFKSLVTICIFLGIFLLILGIAILPVLVYSSVTIDQYNHRGIIHYNGVSIFVICLGCLSFLFSIVCLFLFFYYSDKIKQQSKIIFKYITHLYGTGVSDWFYLAQNNAQNFYYMLFYDKSLKGTYNKIILKYCKEILNLKPISLEQEKIKQQNLLNDYVQQYWQNEIVLKNIFKQYVLQYSDYVLANS